jgi:hypothetical protein
MRRRAFITLLSGGAAAWPLTVRAQQPVMPVIGFMSARSPEDSVHLLEAFRRGLKEGGFVEGENVAIQFRWARGDYSRLPALAEIAWPLAARAQQGERVRRIGILMPFPKVDAESQTWVQAFRQELARLGWSEGSTDVKPGSDLTSNYAQGAAPSCYGACPSVIGRGSPHPEGGCSK